MFVAENLVYLELQKTGGTHIRRLMQQCTDGEAAGKHNRLTEAYRDHFIFGSIRNPWDWYVSLWAYGAGGKGAVRMRVARHFELDYYTRTLPKAMGKNRLSPAELFTSVWHDIIKPVDDWNETYADSDSPERFRRWLKLILGADSRYDFGEGYAFSPVSACAGLLTYRYLRLFTLGDSIYRDSRLASPSGIVEFDDAHNVASAMIRTESLEPDFAAIMEQTGHRYPPAENADSKDGAAERTNSSKRRDAAFYYDDETIALVAEKERFIIDKYAYSPPI